VTEERYHEVCRRLTQLRDRRSLPTQSRKQTKRRCRHEQHRSRLTLGSPQWPSPLFPTLLARLPESHQVPRPSPPRLALLHPRLLPPSPPASLLFPEPYLNPERQRPKRKDPPPVLSCLSSRTRTRTRTAGCTCRRIVASQSRLNKTHPNLSIPSPKKGAQPKVKEGSRCTCAVVASFASLRTRAFLVVNPSVHPPTHLLRRVHAPGLRRRTLGERR
jgi:hypothetical protein